MNKKTKKALEGSIKKWEDIVKGTGVDEGTANCTLCELFTVCKNCPVATKTQNDSCSDTPYSMWLSHQRVEHGVFSLPYTPVCPICKTLAKKELKFLRSLRVKEKSHV